MALQDKTTSLGDVWMSEEIQYKTKSKIRNTYINVIGRVLLLIAVVQAVRLCIDKLLVELFWDRQSIFAYRIISSVTFIIVACLMLAFLRPDRESLGLKSVNDSKYGRLLYCSGAAIVLMLVCTSYSFGVETFVNNISFGIVVPISEELLFRGYIWSRLEQAGGKHSRIAVLAIVTILFGIWHLGYFGRMSTNQNKTLQVKFAGFLFSGRMVLKQYKGTFAMDLKNNRILRR